MNHNIQPDFGQESTPELPEPWLDPRTVRGVEAIKSAGYNLSLLETVARYDTPDSLQYLADFDNDDATIASAWQIEQGDGLSYIGFDFGFATNDKNRWGETVYRGVDFRIASDDSTGIEYNRAFISFSLNDAEQLLAPSQTALQLMRRVDASFDGMLTAWVMDPDGRNFRILNDEEEPFPEEAAEEYRKILARMLGARD